MGQDTDDDFLGDADFAIEVKAEKAEWWYWPTLLVIVAMAFGSCAAGCFFGVGFLVRIFKWAAG